MKTCTPQAKINQKVKLADMSARYFEGRRGSDGNRQYRIVCSSCGVSAQITSKSLMKADAIVGQFTTRKWMVGLGPADDLCPACVLRKRQEAQRQIDRINEMPKDIVMMTKAEQPREMQRSDRQVIWGKLQDVYPKEDAGYLNGWDDDRVSKDLGVPRAWVTKVRDENFGPESKPDNKVLKEYQVVVSKEWANVRSKMAAAQSAVAELDKAMNGMNAAVCGDITRAA